MHFLRATLVVALLATGESASFVHRTIRQYYGDVSEQWFAQQKVDHFDPTNLSTWNQRYFVNFNLFRYYTGPIFLFIGGESKFNESLLQGGSMMEYASTYGALCFGLEHRYYGVSFPLPVSPVENLRYLSSEQALADIAYFIRNMNSKYNLTSENKWVVFGGSYAGMLAAWSRMKYPHLIHAAVASSAPVLAKASVNFGEFAQEVFSLHSTECAYNVHEAAVTVADLLNNPEGCVFLTQKFSPYYPSYNPMDLMSVYGKNSFVSMIVGSIWGKLQVDGVNALSKMCEIMVSNRGDLLDRYAFATSSKLGPFYNLKSLSTTDQQYSWMYQTCTEFGFYTTSTSRRGFFGGNLFLQYHADTCTRLFGDRFNLELLNEGIERTNTMYGGLDIKVTRVVFVQGSLDPWSVLGIKTSKPDAPAIVINGSTHCSDLGPSHPNDSQFLKDARNEISGLIWKWLQVPQ